MVEKVVNEVNTLFMGTLKRVISSIVIFSLIGCSSLGRLKQTQPIYFDSNIPKTEINCEEVTIKTPGKINLRQNREMNCTAKAEGYENQAITRKPSIDEDYKYESIIGNLLLMWIAAPVGWIIDYSSGATKKFPSNKVYVEMKPLKGVL